MSIIPNSQWGTIDIHPDPVLDTQSANRKSTPREWILGSEPGSTGQYFAYSWNIWDRPGQFILRPKIE